MRNSWYILVACLLGLCVACEDSTRLRLRNKVDSLNVRAYGFRYVDIDSVSALAHEALSLSAEYAQGRAEAHLNMAFVAYQQMDFDGVDSTLHLVRSECDKDLLLLCADVMQMKMLQRTGEGERFFEAKSRAESHIRRLSRRESHLSPHDIQLWVYAQTEFHIISSTYYFYQEQDKQARAELDAVPACLQLHVDTAQWVYYNYMLGPGGLVEGRDAREVTLQEFDYLFRAYASSRRDQFRYFEANCLQAFATMFLANDSLLRTERSDAYNLLAFQHAEWQAETEGLPLAFARHALALFQTYNDLFQTACTYRTLGEVYFDRQRYDEALASYTEALHCVNLHHLRYYGAISPDTLSAFDPDDVGSSVEQEWIEDPRVSTVPEWIAGIRQQLSLVFSALDMKQASDYNRNSYLDLLLASNQDLELENRTAVVKRQTRTLYGRMLLCLVLLLVAWRTFALRVGKTRARLEERHEELEEALQIGRRAVEGNKRKNAENRAKVSLVHGIVPFLDRIGGEVLRMKRDGTVSPERREYIMELVDEIERHNVVLTEWIKMEQGQLNLHITTFPLDKLYRIVAEGHYSFDQKQVALCVEPVTAHVKADESLTLFMINTLADNARKFTPAGGTVTLSAEEADDYVEVRVTDTGCGLSPEDVETLTNNKVYDAAKIGAAREGKGFGFGLMNCRGIIEKYKKTSSLFACCTFGVRSRVGAGSTFYFRLPRVARLLLFLLCWPLLSQGATVTECYDSLYQANLQGRYADALEYAAAVIDLLNREHAAEPPMQLMDAGADHVEAAEMLWAKAGVAADYELIVGLRNEVALAALALHDLPLYQYNNRICIRLHKFIHQDTTLPTHFHKLKRTHRLSNLLLILILLISCFILFRIAKTSVLPLGKLRDAIADKEDEQARLDYEQNRLHVQNQILDNCLSTIKHESMFYPSRIRLLAEKMQDTDIDQLAELVQYYRHIYTLLCRQADEQVGQPGFKRQTVEVSSALHRAEAAARRLARSKGGELRPAVPSSSVASPPPAVLADEILLDVLLESLLTGMMHDGAQVALRAEADGDFVRFVLRDARTVLTADQFSTLFFPDASHIPFLLAKQILREHDTYTNHPGCRLVAEAAEEGGYEIYFTLLRENNQ